MAQRNQPNLNQKTLGPEKHPEETDLGANNPVKKEGVEKRSTRENADKANQNLGSQKFREPGAGLGPQDQSAR